jgi:hypothetical protein
LLSSADSLRAADGESGHPFFEKKIIPPNLPKKMPKKTREEESWRKLRKKIPPPRIRLSNRPIYPIFKSPLAGRSPRFAGERFAAADARSGADSQPRSEVLIGRPARHLQTNLGDEVLHGQHAQTGHLRQIATLVRAAAPRA